MINNEYLYHFTSSENLIRILDHEFKIIRF